MCAGAVRELMIGSLRDVSTRELDVDSNKGIVCWHDKRTGWRHSYGWAQVRQELDVGTVRDAGTIRDVGTVHRAFPGMGPDQAGVTCWHWKHSHYQQMPINNVEALANMEEAHLEAVINSAALK
eukprot:1160410-Pelagomonas_calceolata.AAC.4